MISHSLASLPDPDYAEREGEVGELMKDYIEALQGFNGV
jgi:hypothetical protein